MRTRRTHKRSSCARLPQTGRPGPATQIGRNTHRLGGGHRGEEGDCGDGLHGEGGRGRGRKERTGCLLSTRTSGEERGRAGQLWAQRGWAVARKTRTNNPPSVTVLAPPPEAAVRIPAPPPHAAHTPRRRSTHQSRRHFRVTSPARSSFAVYVVSTVLVGLEPHRPQTCEVPGKLHSCSPSGGAPRWSTE